jgi:cytochrome c peroxidase
MHDGSMETLWDVVAFFNKGGEPNQYLDKDMKPLALSADEVDDLVNFMNALTSDRFSAQAGPELDRQHTSFLYRAAVSRASSRGSR